MSAPNIPFIQPQFMPLSIARALWKGKLLVVLVWAVITAAACYWVKGLPAVYQSEAVIMVDAQKIPREYVAATVNTGVQERLASINQQILSSTRMRQIIEDFDLYAPLRRSAPFEDVLTQMRKDISINVGQAWGEGRPPGSIKVGYTGPSANVVAQVANRVANLYIEENLKSREVQAEGTAEFVENLLVGAKKRLDDMETAVSQYKMRHYGQLPEQENTLVGALNRLEVQFQANTEALRRAEEGKITLENSLAAAEVNVTAFRRAYDLAKEAAATSTDGYRPPVILGGAPVPAPPGKLEILRNQLDTMRLRYAEGHPEIRRLKAELARAERMEQEKEQIEHKKEDTPATAAAAVPEVPAPRRRTVTLPEPPELIQARDRVTAIRNQIADTVKEIGLRKSEQQRIQRDIGTYQARIEGLPLREQEMARLLRDYEHAKGEYNGLVGKRTSAEMGRDLERRQKAERFTLLEPAPVPRSPIRPNRPLYAGIGSGIGLAIALLLAFGLEWRRGVLLGEWELPAHIPVLGRLPNIELSYLNSGRDART